jgi:LuxR family transcriptional regulator, maltose regulon positive regulatory protein
MAQPAAWPSAGVLAVTKLQIPGRRTGLVRRDALVGLLAGARDARLTLVSAPPGAGKTTLLGEWAADPREERPFAWLSLDPDDGDPVRFWSSVVEALRIVHPGFGAPVASALRAVGQRLVDVIVPLFVNEASELREPTVLVLDDLHVVESPEIHRSLGFLVDHLPGTLHLAVTTRSDPPLPLARWRARGELVEVRDEDLQFSDEEAAALLADGFGLTLDREQVARLQAETEGWAAGLQLAAISLRRGVDFDVFLEGLRAGSLQIHDYLCGEVLDAQPDALRRFLLDTSVLDRMCAPLCDALTADGEADERLLDLERRNLLLVPLDGTRQWWRYHHLFGDLLRRELARDDPARPAELHRRAAAWHRENGLPEGAIRHALAGGDAATAADLAAEHWSAAFNRGELTTVEGWLAALPAERVAADEQLWLARLWIAMDRGRLDDAAALLGAAPENPTGPARSWGLVLHALHAFKRGDVGGAEERLATALERDTADRFLLTAAQLLRGVVDDARGRPAASEAFAEAAELAEEDGNRLGLGYALGYRGLLAAEAGRDAESGAALARLDALLADDPAIGEHFVAFAGCMARAALAERTGAYEHAATELGRAVELARRGAGRLELARGLAALGTVHWARGRREDARGLARAARHVLDACPVPGRVAERVRELERRTHIAAAVPDGPREALSESELAVLRMLPSQLSNREIGEQLYISVNTVKTHLRNVYAKLRVSSREQAAGRARELGLL